MRKFFSDPTNRALIIGVVSVIVVLGTKLAEMS